MHQDVFLRLIFVKPESEAKKEGEADEKAVSTEPVKWEAISPYKQPLFADEKGMLAEGDALTDFSAAIRAIGAGRRGAASVHKIMYGIELDLPKNVIKSYSVLQNVDQIENVNPAARQIMPMCSSSEMGSCGELEKGFSEEMAKKESSRCLQCGLICYEHNS